MSPSPRIRRVLGAGVRLHVAEHGLEPASGVPTVVLVHGYPDTSAVWHDVVTELVRDHHVVTYDVRGAGRSESPSRTVGYRLESLLADLGAVIAAVRPDGAPVHLVGHDWGAIQVFAAAAVGSPIATRVVSCTALSAPGLDVAGHWWRGARRPRQLAAVAGQLRRSWYVLAFRLPLLPRLVWRTVLGPRWPRLVGDLAGPGYPAATLVDDAVRGVALYRANAGRLLRPGAVRFAVPVRVLTGVADPFVSPRVFDRLDQLGDDVVVTVVDAGHWLPRSHPTTVAHHVRTTVAG